MDIEALIKEKIQRLLDLNRQMGDIAKKIGTLQEEGRALHGASLEIKGAIDALAELKGKEDADKSKGLILPDKSLVAPDGKTVIAQPAEPVAETKGDVPATVEATPAVAVEAPKADAPVLEVK